MKIRFLLPLILAFAIDNQLFACSCNYFYETQFDEYVKTVGVIVVGKVIKSERADFLNKNSDGHLLPRYVKNTVVFTEIYKGKFKRDTLLIFTGIGGGDCGFGFSVGQSYLIYGYRSKYLSKLYGKSKKLLFETDKCTPTSLHDSTAIAKINAYLKPKPFKKRCSN